MAKFPMGKIPVFESAEVNLFESNAIAYYGKDI
jgi:elongation factor 1-gamma